MAYSTIDPITGKPFPSPIPNIEEDFDDGLTFYDDLINKARELESVNRSVNDSFRDLIVSMAKGSRANTTAFRSLATQQYNAIENSKDLVATFETNSKKISNQIKTNTDLVNELTSELKNNINDFSEEEQKAFYSLIENIESSTKNLENLLSVLKETPQFGFADAIEKFTKNIPVIGELIPKITGPFKEGMIKALKVGKSGTEALAAGFTNIKKIGLQALFIILVEEAFKVNQQITELQRNFGLTNVQAIDLRANLSQLAFQSGDVFINSQKLLESFNAISGELGFQVKASGQMLETFTNLTKRMGFNNSEATQLSVLTGLQSENTEQVLDNTIKTINASRDSNKLFNNTKLILQDIAGASAATIVSLGKSPDLLAKAATKARELGLNLSQVERIADSLLNFESSIASELTAELITGKQLNLERARFLALTNDLVGLQDELAKQGLNFTEYTEMSRIGQQALAESLGMGRDEMSQMLFNQEKQLLAQRASRGELDKQTLAQFQALSAQEKFNESVAKLRDLLSTVVIAFSPILDIIAAIADVIGFVLKPIGSLINVLRGGQSSFTQMQDGIIPADGSPVVLRKGQLPVQGIPEDNVMLSTNTPSSSLPSLNIQPLIDEIKMLRQEIKQYQSVPIVVENNIDGDLLGRGIRRGISRGTSTVPSVYT